ncbi:CPBP family intramembrane metalloprotease [Duganella sp. FT50W]|uniref:CPBP family intramembrane metalloprotease n=1 Tax=Duganella lactea TaxID=2692173 RepID=A0A6L8MQ80_9BURK|nr:CPBP family intramembrane glutamic endopeptidase [Duganella lactea]MYM83485.1 CPBP family intramembrane metalloprotease [Duganella lactea]
MLGQQKQILSTVGAQHDEHAPMAKSLAWTALLLIEFLVAPLLVLLFYYVANHADGNARPPFSELTSRLSTPVGLLEIALCQCLIQVPTILLAARACGPQIKTVLGLLPVRRDAVKPAMIAFLIYISVEMFLGNLFHNENPILKHAGDTTMRGLIIIPVVFISPIMEELIFRGFLFFRWNHRTAPWQRVNLFISLLFSMMHLGGATLFTVCSLFVFSLLLGWVRQRSASIYPAIALHIINNAIPVISEVLF